MGEAACGELLAAASSEEPTVPKAQGAHAASVLPVQPGSCLRDAEMRSLGVLAHQWPACSSMREHRVTRASFMGRCEQK